MDAPLDTLNALRISGSLPSMPQVLVQLIDSCHDPDVRLQTIARIVDKDAAISAKILQLVNSSAVGAARAFTNPSRRSSTWGSTRCATWRSAFPYSRSSDG